jgi:uncharacterized protein YigA (DUF484 family)
MTVRSPKKSAVHRLKGQLRRERRTNRRLRNVIDDLKTEVTANRRDLDVQFTRIAQVQAEIDDLRKAWKKISAP